MQFTFKNGGVSKTLDDNYIITLTIPKTRYTSDLGRLIANDKLKSCEIKEHRKKRSINANAALWLLLGKMAAVMKTTKEELYNEMIKRYGQFNAIALNPKAVDDFKRRWSHPIEDKGIREVDGKKVATLLCYFGSSEYNTKEFTQLLDGVIDEAKAIDIDFISQEERARLIDGYEKSRTKDN